MLARARAFAEPLISHEQLETSENTLAHADAVVTIVAEMGGSEAMQAATYLVYSCQHLNRPREVIAKAFGDNFAALAVETTKLVQVQIQTRSAMHLHANAGAQTESVRKMLLAFSRDLRVVMLRLASRLQTLRYAATSRQPVSEGLARESLQVFAPLANRLGIWQVKWEIEDLSFRFLEPATYKHIAQLLDEKRVEREGYVAQLRARLERELSRQGIAATVQGRPKNIYSIVKKMRGKSVDFDQVFDILALRVIVAEVKDCYAVLSWVHEHFQSIAEEFDDYIAKPKANGYQSLHTVVRDVAPGRSGKPIEIQIRTEEMHDHAEHGVAAHWAYKEAGPRGYTGVWAGGEYDAKIAVLRQLLAWERDLSGSQRGQDLFDDRIYVLTPEAAVIELPQGATPVDFAYAVHTELGHRCRGARVDGAMVPLNTALQNGQSVEIIAAKEGGPSRDWLNAELGYLASPRARAKVRAWFNAQVLHETVARGRETVEKLLQREGRTALKLDDLAAQLGFRSSEQLFEVVGKDEFSTRHIEGVLRPVPGSASAAEEAPVIRKSRASHSPQGGVLVVGVSSLLTQLAKCCKPAPPDVIAGYVTRGHGVSIHRADCSNLRIIATRESERLIDVAWGEAGPRSGSLNYAVDVAVEAADRQGLLRDISDVFVREKMNVVGVQTQSVRGTAWMTFTIEISDTHRLAHVLSLVTAVAGVRWARRR